MNRINAREEQLFADAIARPAAQRMEFLDTACGDDDALRRRLEALLIAHEAPDGALPAPFTPDFTAFADEAPGTVIGRYTLRRKIGEGGCGTVWLAEQEEPVRRQVALKVIKAGMDTREVIARFAAERQALAIMDHPGIAKVLDAGATNVGRPFFVMELVRGTRITEYCDEHVLSMTARLELFVEVCHAVQHAHQKGVIHRDLKPSNILVTRPDNGVGQVKVIDFGIAKATQGRLADGTIVTSFDQFIGTPAYMSPEQADTSGMDVDTRSDVYSLGVLLYELLTGEPPFDPKSLNQLSREELRRLIREVDPPKPSARFASLGAAQRETLGRLRGADPVRLAQLLAGDLDWIVMKAIEKDRARRYETATALAADITHHLRQEPVTARPPSARYRVGKLIRRNRLAFAAAAVVAFTLVGGSAASIWQAVRARQAERAAEGDRHRAVLARSRAMDERARAVELLRFMLGDLRSELRKVGRLDLLETVANEATAYFASLPTEDFDSRALAMHVTALGVMGELRLDQARYVEAERAYAAAHKRAAELLIQNPADTEALFARGQTEWGNGYVRYLRGETAAAREWFTRYDGTARELVALEPDSPRWQLELASGQRNLAALEMQSGQFDRAREAFRAEWEVRTKLLEQTPMDSTLKGQICDVLSFLATIAERTGDLREAVRLCADQTRQLNTLKHEQPQNTHWGFKRAESNGVYASTLAITGEVVAARRILADAHADLAALSAVDPSNRRWKQNFLTIRLREAMVARALGQWDVAAAAVDEARRGLEALLAIEPSGRTFTARLALACRLDAELRHDRGEGDAAAVVVAKALELGANLVGGRAQMSPERGEYANACITAGLIASAVGDAVAARGHWQRGYDLIAPFAKNTRDWRVLDPWIRLNSYLERADAAESAKRSLGQTGYVPLQPWPDV